MKLSRRGFLGKALKGLVVAAIAPILPTVTKSITANPVPPVPNIDNDALIGRVIKSRKYEFSCKDFSPQITIYDYKPGQTIPYEDFSDVKPSCTGCQYAHACTATGKKFVKHKPFIPEIWSKKLQAEWYKKGSSL